MRCVERDIDRAGGDRTPEDGIKKVLNVEITGMRGKGRPPVSWLQCIERNIDCMNLIVF